MRVYLPGTWRELEQLATQGGLGPRSGYAVTDSLRASHPQADLEQLEYFAGALAATESATLVRAHPDPDLPQRRIVLATDLPPADVGLVPGSAQVNVHHRIDLGQVASAQVDDFGADLDSGADQLLWFDVLELAGLVAESGSVSGSVQPDGGA